MDVFVGIMLVVLFVLTSLSYLSIAYLFHWLKSKLYATGAMMFVTPDALENAEQVTVSSDDDDDGEDEDGDRRRAYL
jgi:hypothetical protein